EEVFDFLTTPANWPRWHPSSVKVRGAADHPLAVGEQVTEDFHVAGQYGTAVWTVREREAPRRWVIDGAAGNGDPAPTPHTRTPQQGGTLVERELVFTQLPAAPAAEAREGFRRTGEAESAEALRRVKGVLEEGLPPGA